MPPATIGGYRILGNKSVSWALTSGTRPHRAVFNLMLPDAEALLKGGLAPVTLVIGSCKFKNLYVIQRFASDDPNYAAVEVVDRRWWWTFKKDRRRYNFRRKKGFYRAEDPNTLAEAQDVLPVFDYWPWSLKGNSNIGHNGKPWTPDEVFDDIMKWAVQAEVDAGQPKAKFGLDNGAAHLVNARVENFMVEGSAAEALDAVLDYFPGTGLYVDEEGAIHGYPKSAGGEAKMLKAVQWEKVGRGHVDYIKLDLRRPKQIDVKFYIWSELRLDATAEAGQSSTTQENDAPEMTNVLPVTDFTLTVSGVKVPMGTYITFQQAITAWGNCPGLGRPITFEDIRIHCGPFGSLEDVVAAGGTLQPDQDWAGRVAAIRSSFRRTYRVSSHFMRRLYNLQATRVALLDSANVASGKASCYSDYSYQASERTLAHEYGGGSDGTYIFNVAAFDGGTIDSAVKLAPAEVSIIDADLGIIEIDYKMDQARAATEVFPSQCETLGTNAAPGAFVRAPGPQANLLYDRATGRGIVFDALGDVDKPCQLCSAHRKALVVSASPAPGGTGEDTGKQFVTVTIKPEDIKASFPGKASCLGPVMEVIVGAGFETARVMWSDEYSEQILALFGIGKVQPGAINPRVINLKAGTQASQKVGASLNAIAMAVADSVYQALADRSQGGMMGDMVPGIRPSGWISEVGYGLEPNGELWTKLDLPQDIPPFNLLTYLPTSVRNIIDHVVNP